MAGTKPSQRTRHDLYEEQKLRQLGITPQHRAILEGVYELEKRPEPHAEMRLATQLEVDVLAAWFRSRRVRDKRRKRAWAGLGVATVGLLVVIIAIAVQVSRGIKRKPLFS